jgi:hypothetical protein
MEQLKVKKKDTIITNVVFYLTLSFCFLYLQHAYRHHLSPFSLVYFRKGLELFWYVALTLIVAMVVIWRQHRFSIFFYQLSVLLVGFKVLEGLFVEFNKIIVIALFFFIIISYFLYQLLNYYLELASINPNYDHSDLFEPLLRKITCQVQTEDLTSDGYLTNWDDEGCFIKLNQAKSFNSNVKVKIFFSDREFTQEGEVVAATPDSLGIGIKFESTAKEMNIFNWSEFVQIVHELGFKPKRLR